MTPETLADLSARAYRHMQPWTAEQFAQTLASPHTVLAHTPHAFVLGRVIVDEAEILALAADPDFQRQGHAARALKQFHTSAQTRGATQIFLEVAARNIGARTFYQGQGYSESGLRKNYPESGGAPENVTATESIQPAMCTII